MEKEKMKTNKERKRETRWKLWTTDRIDKRVVYTKHVSMCACRCANVFLFRLILRNKS